MRINPTIHSQNTCTVTGKIKLGVYNELPSHYSNRLKLCIYACLITDPQERADVNQLLQETSFKIYRREWELNQKELELVKREIDLKRKDSILNRQNEEINLKENELLLKEKQLIKYDKVLEDQKKKINTQNEETRRVMRTEFKLALEDRLTKILSDLPPDIQVMLKTRSKENRVPNTNQYYYGNAQAVQPLSPSTQKLRGPRTYEDYNDENLRYKR